jgi:hypothetical protein
VLKKAGIVVATSVAALLAVSPLAFAGDYNDDNGGNGHHSRSHHHGGGGAGNGSCDQNTTADTGRGRRGDDALIDISRNAVQVPIQACNNNVLNNIGAGVLGRGTANGGNIG